MSASAGEAEGLAGPLAELAVAARARFEARLLLLGEGALEAFLAPIETVHDVGSSPDNRLWVCVAFAAASGLEAPAAACWTRSPAAAKEPTFSAEAVEISKMSFEVAMAELEGIVDRLEKGNVTLEESIQLYERGEALKARCDALLKDAEMRIDKIMVGADGKAKGVEPLDPEIADAQRSVPAWILVVLGGVGGVVIVAGVFVLAFLPELRPRPQGILAGAAVRPRGPLLRRR